MFTGLTIIFLQQFWVGIELTSPLLISLTVFIALFGQIAGRKEGWSRFDSLYWSFIDATTVGYGDIRPTGYGSRVIAMFIGFLGLILSGIIVAIAIPAATVALERTGI